MCNETLKQVKLATFRNATLFLGTWDGCTGLPGARGSGRCHRNGKRGPISSDRRWPRRFNRRTKGGDGSVFDRRGPDLCL